MNGSLTEIKKANLLLVGVDDLLDDVTQVVPSGVGKQTGVEGVDSAKNIRSGVLERMLEVGKVA